MLRPVLIALIALIPLSKLNAQMEPMKPTEHHQVLKRDVGTWHAKVKMFNPVTGEAEENEATEVNQLVCNGLWLSSRFKGEVMGTELTGHAMLGYDTIKQKYVGTWVDNFSSSMMTMEGEFDPEKEQFVFIVKGTEPDGTPMEQVHTVKYNEDGTRTFVMESQGTKILEVHYTRRDK